MVGSTGTREATRLQLKRHGARAPDPLLRSKIIVPGLPAWTVPRPRLEARIAEGTHGPLTSVTGPPGAGKTITIASWAAHYGPGPAAWVTLDEFDNKPGVFWPYVVAALRQAGVTVPRASYALARGKATGHVFLLQLAAALSVHDPPVVLVLDDLHAITDPATLGGLAYVMRNARPGLRLVVASRPDPPLPLHQYRLTGELTEIRAGDLAFSVPESALLMAQHGITLPAASLKFITECNEGWAAGLRMAAISMEGHRDPGQVMKNIIAADGAVSEYLMEEVLGSRPRDVRDLLVSTSILDRVNPDIAQELAGSRHAASTLENLARGNSFIQPLGQGWYRYHSLFRAALHMKLRREQPDSVMGLHRQAACWYQRSGSIADAVYHAGKAGDRQLAARILVDELAVGRLTGPGNGELLADEFRQVPEAPQGQLPPQFLLAAAAVALSDGRDRACESLLGSAEHILAGASDDQETPSRFGAALLRFGLACRSGDFGTAGAAASGAVRLLERFPENLRARRPGACAQALSARGVVDLWSGDLGRAARLLGRAARLLDGAACDLVPAGRAGTDFGYERAACRGHLALLEALRGRLDCAAELADAAAVVHADGSAGRPGAAAAVALALVHLERNELNASRSQLKLADAALRAHPSKLISAVGCLVAARGSLAEGHAHATAEMARRARAGWSPPPWLDHMLLVAESHAHAASGDAEAAVATAAQAGPDSALDARVALARALLAAGDVAEARQALAGAAETSAGEAPERVRAEAWLADSLLAFRTADPVRGRRSLERALKLSEPQRLRLPFAVERSWIRPALARYPELAHTHRHLLEPRLIPPGPLPGAPHPPPGREAPVLVEQLSRREHDVLHRVADMLSTDEIASDMYISVNTVKTHLKNIFRKLGVADRGAAVRRARQLAVL
jgi:LuxR family maltose regulon positive regulatory protein